MTLHQSHMGPSGAQSRASRRRLLAWGLGLAMAVGGSVQASSAAMSSAAIGAPDVAAPSLTAKTLQCGDNGVRICTPHGCYCA